MGSLALIAALPLLGFLVNGLFGARLPRRLVAADRLRAAGACIRDHGGALHAPRLGRARDRGDALLLGRPCELQGRRRPLLRRHDGGHVPGRDRHRHADPRLLRRIHGGRQGLRALLRVPQPVPVLHAAARARQQPARALRGLGRRRARVVSVDRILVRGSREDGRGRQGVHRQPRRRRRLRGRGVPHLHPCRLVRLPGHQRLLFDAGAVARRDHDHRPAAAARRVRQVGADPAACLAAGRDGRADAGVRADSCGHHGHRRRVPARAPERALPARARSDGGRRLDRRRDGTARRDDGRHAIQPEEGARLLDDLADRLHGHGLRRRRVLRRAVPPDDARVLQGLPVPGRRRRPARAAGRGRHAQHGRPRAQAALHLRHVPGGNAGAVRNPAVRRLLLEGRDPLAGLVGAGRLALAVARRSRGLRAHRLLHVPRDLPDVLRHEPCRGTASGRRARAAAFDVDRARRARRRLARRRVHRHARLPARAPRRLGAVLRLSRAAVPRGACASITLRAPRSR